MFSRVFRRIFDVTPYDWRYRCALLAGWVWRRLMFRTTFIAITGSVGKTTATGLLSSILATQDSTFTNYGSGNRSERILRAMFKVRFSHRFAVFEVATRGPGFLKRSAWLVRPDIAVILNVARTHTRGFPTLDDTAVEKSVLLRYLRRKGTAVLNRDDSRVAAMAKLLPAGCRVVWFGSEPGAEVHGSEISSHWPDDPLSLTISAGTETSRAKTQLVGEHWKTSVLGAIAAALECRVPLQQAVAALAEVQPPSGRMAPRTLPSGVTFLRDDYNPSEDTLHVALEVLRQATAPRKILVFSGVIDTGESWTQRMARHCEAAAKIADLLVLISDRGCTRAGARAARAAGMDESQIAQFTNLREASDFLKATCRAGDLVLLRGRLRDHIGRLYIAQKGEIGCWVAECEVRTLCEACPELQPAAGGLIAPIDIRTAGA